MKNIRGLIRVAILLPVICIFLAFLPIREELNPVFQGIIQKFGDYFSRLPQQKVYLNFDKSAYKADETVWFKATLVKASSHIPDGSTTNLYVDLINPSGYNVQSKLIRMTNGFGKGDFSFNDTIPEGVYKVRAFTNWMRNTDEKFFFEKEIYISNPDFSTYVTREELQKIKKERRRNRKSEADFDIQFLPEGGHLLAGIENKVGFKAINELGHGTLVTGDIFDSKGNKIISVSSSQLGIGSFVFTPAINEKYFAVLNTGGDKPVKVTLPGAIPMGINITASKSSDNELKVSLSSNFQAGQLPPNTLYFLVAQSRGRIIYTHEFDIKNQPSFINLSTKDIPTGILHLTLFNVLSQPVSERLVFINNHDELKVQVESSFSEISSREKAVVNIKVHDKEQVPVPGFFSLSIVNSEDAAANENIISNLLLTSDLKGYIENPQYYFANRSGEKEKQLDDLMLTQGWSRFNWASVLAGSKAPPEYENEKGIIITGKITKEFFNIPLRDSKVTLSILNEFNDVFSTRSGDKGAFRFDNLDYSDTVSASIEATRGKGKRNLLIYVDSKPDMQDKKMKYQTRQNLQRRGEMGRYAKQEDPDADDPFYKENHRINRIHEEPSPSNVIIIDEKTQNYQSVGQILEGRVPGVMVTGNKVSIRGLSSLYGNTDPLFLVDGMQVDADYAMSMNPFDVERIEVLKGPETAIYGSRGANGVIAIYTKRGKFMKRGVIDFQMLGYYTPREYYNPRFEYRSDDPIPDDRRTILWVPDLITDSKGEARVEFYTSDIKGKYTVIIEGISKEGTPGAAYLNFNVR